MLRPWSQQARQLTGLTLTAVEPDSLIALNPTVPLRGVSCGLPDLSFLQCLNGTVKMKSLACLFSMSTRRPWSQQPRQLTPRRGTVAHLGNRSRCVHIHTGNLSASSMVTAGATANTTEGNSRASRELGFVVFLFTRKIYRSPVVAPHAGATANTTEGNTRASRGNRGLLCSHSHGESIATP